MRRAPLGGATAGLILAGFLGFSQNQPVEFSKDVEPVFRRKCIVCHNEKMANNGLRLDDGAAALAGGYTGPVIVPGKSAESKLILRVTSEKKTLMMPPGGPALSAAEIATLRAWIDGGAKWPRTAKAEEKPKTAHWSFQPVQRPAAPDVRGRSWVRNPIDNFVLARLEAEGIRPSEEASKETLLRRVSLDLTGLPPTPRETAEFLGDNRADAYERLVGRLLASPHYGEMRARQWLDLARYADSDGYEKDQTRPYAWRWRNYVIDSFNQDKPFDQFTVEQLAGDLLPDATVEQKVATGFHRNTLANREAGVDRSEARFEQVVNRTATVGTVWMGLTVGCAQCHDHKFDPISQKEFYQFYAYFNRADEEDIEAPLAGEMGPYLRARPGYEQERAHLLAVYDVEALQKEWEPRMLAAMDKPGDNLEWDFAATSLRAMLDHAERILRTPVEKRTALDTERLTRYFIYNPGPSLGRDVEKLGCFRDLRRRLSSLDAETPKLTMSMTLTEFPEAPKTYVSVRGDYREKGIEVQPGVLRVLPPLPAGAEPNRMALARWLVRRDHPLTSRVTVNRMWQELFGRGLVRTSEDFGTQGERPTHPELLDWLAAELMDGGWSYKRMLRLMVTSAAYRQSSDTRKDLAEKDPENTLVARQTRVRLTAEQIRDAALASGGLLDLRVGGASIKPPQPAGLDALGYAGSVKWADSEGPDRYRRGLYVFYQRTVPYPQLVNFDAPDSTVTCSRRRRSNTPLQALNLLNDPVFVEAAQGLALRLMTEAKGSPSGRIEQAFLLALGRKPSPQEAERVLKFYDEQLSQAPAELMPLVPEGVKPNEAAAWVSVSRVMLNLDEFMTRE
jgi:hypothetical protein